jgi:transcriptional regulator with XRE-family HTH domain
MTKRTRTKIYQNIKFLREWRESLGLSRQAVVNRLGVLLPGERVMDQATIAKWESGETLITVADLELLAQVYGVTADRLHFAPGDTLTPMFLGIAHEIVTSRDPEAIKAWLASGKFLPQIKEE